ncbi:zinc finger, CCHC-type containing protein [Tanacetum coccineum]
MVSMNTRLNIEKLDGNIVQKHGGSKQVGLKQLGSKQVGFKKLGVKQVGFKQLGPGVETGVHRVSNDDTAVSQRQLEDKQPEEKTNTDCLIKEQEKEYQTGWKIKMGIQQQNGLIDETNMTLFAMVRCFLIQSGLSKVFWAEDTTMSTYLVNRSPASTIRFKTPVDMLGFFGWLASIKQGMLEPVKVKCIFLGYRKGIVGTGSVQVLQGVEFEVEPHGNVDHVVGSHYREDRNEAAFAVAAMDKIYAHESLTFNDTVACEVISKWKAGLKEDTDVRSDVYVLSNGYRKSSDDSHNYYWEYAPVKAKGNVLGLEIIRDQSGNTLRVSQSRIHNKKLVQPLLKGDSTLSLEDSLSGDCDVEKNGK